MEHYFTTMVGLVVCYMQAPKIVFSGSGGVGSGGVAEFAEFMTNSASNPFITGAELAKN